MSKMRELEHVLFDLVKQARLSARRNREAQAIFAYGSKDERDFKDVGDELDVKINAVINASNALGMQVE